MRRVIFVFIAAILAASPLRSHGAEPRSAKDNVAHGAQPVPDPAPGPQKGAPAVAAQKGAPEDYRIGAEDQLRVSVWDNKELTQDVVVRPDGKISLPLLQDVDANGYTASELATELARRLSAFLKEPQVSVILLQVNAPKVFVIGNVTRPGPYPLRGSMTVLQLLSVAGGMTPFAKTGSIRIVRQAEEGKQKVRKIDYDEMIESEGKGNYFLRAGDTIVVP